MYASENRVHIRRRKEHGEDNNAGRLPWLGYVLILGCGGALYRFALAPLVRAGASIVTTGTVIALAFGVVFIVATFGLDGWRMSKPEPRVDLSLGQ